MSYDDVKQELGKTPIYIVELDLDYCQNTYGVSPCMASGADKCFNTFKTCQDILHFNKGVKTYRFSSLRVDGLQQAGDGPTFPTLIDISMSPTKLEPSKGLGVRSSVKIKLQDHPWTDQGIDPYVSERSYNPDDKGSFWARFLARNPYWQNRPIRIKQGYLDSNGNYDENNMKTRLYIISQISGPDSKGTIQITGKDILKFADSERAKIPLASEAVLFNDIDETATTFNISDPTGQIKASYDSGQVYAIIDEEVIEMTSVTGANGLYSVTCNRATLPSYYSRQPEAAEHDEGDTIQHCYHYFNTRADDIIYDLLNRVAGIPSQYLDDTQWDTKMAEGLNGYLFSRLIVEPTGVKDLLTEITEHTITIWWDEREQKVLMDTLYDHTPNGSHYSDSDNLIDGSVSSTTDVGGRVSQVWVYLGIRSPLLTDGDAKDYGQVVIRADLDFESDLAYDSASIMEIKSNWMPAGLGSVASEIASRLVRNYREAKTVITMSLDAKDDENWTGDKVEVSTRYVKDELGDDKRIPYKITQVNEALKLGGVKYSYVLESEITVNQEAIGVITPTLVDGNPFPNYRDANGDQRIHYAFIAPNGAYTFYDGKVVNEVQ